MKNSYHQISNFFYNGKKKIVSTWAGFTQRLQQRILDNKEKVQANARGVLFFEILDRMEEILYRRKIMKWLMPFIEYILIGYLLLIFFAQIIITKNIYGFESFSILPLILCGLCMIKRKYLVTFFGLLSITVERVLLLKKYHDYTSLFGDKITFTFFIFCFETAVFVFLLFKLLGIWYRSKSGIKVRYNLANLLIKSTNSGEELRNRLNQEPNYEINNLLKKEILKEQSIDNAEYISLDEEVINQLKMNVDLTLAATEEKIEEN